MFRSKTRNLIFPQSEHLRLSGAIALHWGNAEFAQPALNFESFVAGAALHDWGHYFFDSNEIGAMDAETLRRSRQALVAAQLDDPIADIVMNYHVLRLLSDEPTFSEQHSELQQKVAAKIDALGLSAQTFERADRITNLADMISFDFCFERPVRRTMTVYRQNTDEQQHKIAYELHEGGIITMNPWPLSVPEIRGYMLAYAADGYPQRLAPQVVPYVVRGVG